jgi:hypothetical protein
MGGRGTSHAQYSTPGGTDVSDQPMYQPPDGNETPRLQQSDVQPQTSPGQFSGPVPPIYPPPPEYYTPQNFPPPAPLPPQQAPMPAAYPQYAQYPPYPQYPQPGGYGVQGYGAPPMPQEQGSGLAVAGLIVGIISIPAALIAICGFAFGVVGVILSALGRRSPEHRTLANYGLALSIVGLVLSVASSAIGEYMYLTNPGMFHGILPGL